ncbi:sugar phosphate isomerase/epimerase family protein [Alicyclobacillus acidiphilus]|uniref:sugar phosphate isomerase/epimerase family protein n=1 Tax=Alicyclobacillus acidiphilus TaxID=182455 RepID=UPI00082EBA15|nr:sugar phosphate isomerase/epimerase [Alicyclobacillus acidiphilus]
MTEIGVQLYTLRDLLAKDFVGTLRKVSEIGYRAVELHHYGGLEPTELRKVLDDLNLRPVSSHVALNRFESELDQVIDEAKAIGLEYLVCPFLPQERRQSKADYEALAGILAKAAQACKAAGIKLGYHNHDFEFETFDGTTALDLLLTALESEGVQMELDVYWAHKAGYQPTEFLRRYAGRADLLHAKDMSKETGAFETVGKGVLDWNSLFEAASAAGVKYYIVEQDVCPGDPLESIAASLAFLQEHLKA